jgi:Na+-translocating ferredoxin:NAD+ oxidoreductase RnfG subunit
VNDALRSIIILTLFSIGGGGIAVFFNSMFSPSIEAQTVHIRSFALERMFPGKVNISEVAGKKPLPPRYWIVKNDSAVVAYAFPIETRGYAGAITSLVGIDTTGVIEGVKILTAGGMPAIGMTVEDFIPKNSLWRRLEGTMETSESWFTAQFRGTAVNRPFVIDTLDRRKAASTAVSADRRDGNRISAVSGATASTRALVVAIRKNAASFLLAVKEPGR